MVDVTGPFYKFLDKEFVHCLLEGNLRLRSANYFRLLEAVFDDCWIGDVEEGERRTYVNLEFHAGEQRSEGQQIFLEMGVVGIEGDFSGTVRSTVRTSFNGYLFCFSQGELDALAARMCSAERANYAYDGCVRILSAFGLKTAIEQHGFIGEERVSDSFEVICGAVHYGEQDTALTRQSLERGEAFLKAVKYCAQQEVRIVLQAKPGVLVKDFVDVSIHGDHGLMAEESINYERVSPAVLPLLSSEQAWATLIRLYRTIEMSPSRQFISPFEERSVAEERRKAIGEEKEREWEKCRSDVGKAYWVLRPDFPYGLLESCLFGNHPLDWGVGDYLRTNRQTAGLAPNDPI